MLCSIMPIRSMNEGLPSEVQKNAGVFPIRKMLRKGKCRRVMTAAAANDNSRDIAASFLLRIMVIYI